jgi:acetyltransferase
MKAFFKPNSVALIGASSREKSIGNQLLTNLTSGSYEGKIYPINPRYSKLGELKCFSKISQIRGDVDLAILALASGKLPTILEECGKKGVKAVVIIAAGFWEIGEDGIAIEKELLEIAKKWGIRVLGTHSIGLSLPHIGLNASFLEGEIKSGNIAFVSQSGALCNAILDWSRRENIGFSAFVSLGAMSDVSWADILTELGEDYRTQAILIYMESIGDARAFISAAREVAFSKPIIAMKAGETGEGASAAMLHNNTISGNHEILDAAFRRCGVLGVDRIAELFFMASVLSKQPISKGKKLAILSNAAGPAILATDTLIKGDGELATLSEVSIEELKKKKLSNRWNITNPLDIQYQSTPTDFEEVTELLMRDQENDAVLVIITPQLHCPAEEVAQRLVRFKKITSKPLIVSILGGMSFDNSRDILNEAGIPVLLFPDAAVRVFNYMWRYAYNIKGLYETPRPPEIFLQNRPPRLEMQEQLQTIHSAGRTLLSKWEVERVMEAYGLPTTHSELVHSPEEAVEVATKIKFPVVLKLNTSALKEVSSIGGIKLALKTKKQVLNAYEKIRLNAINNLGETAIWGILVQKMHQYTDLDLAATSHTDEFFGPTIRFGSSGRVVRLYKDYAVGLPTLNTTLAHRMMEQTKIYQALQKNYGIEKEILERIEQFLVQFSHLIAEQPLIKEVDINPLAVSANDLVILDAKITLHNSEESKSIPPLAIRPYPYEYEEIWDLKDDYTVFVRPIRPDDEPLAVDFHKNLSDESVYFRYFYSASFNYRVSHKRLAKICFVDYEREIAVVVLSKTQPQELLAVGRIIKLNTASSDKTEAEFALSVIDGMQGLGMGSRLMDFLIRIAKNEGIGALMADILPENKAMKQVCLKFGFEVYFDEVESILKARLEV